MTNHHAEVAPRPAAQIAGYGYLVIFVLAIFANFLVLERLIEPGDAAATAGNIIGSEATFRLGLASFLVIFALDVVIAWALYVVFRQVNRDLSLLTAWFRLVYTTLLGVAVIFLFLALQLISGTDDLTAFTAGQRDAQLMMFLEGFNYAWLIGLGVFGVHLALLGYLVLRSGSIPRILGVLLTLAGAGYVIDTLAHALLAGYDDYATLFLLIAAVPSLIGELSLAVWLLLRGGRQQATPPAVLEADPAPAPRATTRS
jgi:Domain of unknown function (DUF4386)